MSPPARSTAAVVILSAFSLPLLPPQMVNATENPTNDSSNRKAAPEELRPHSSPGVNSNPTSTSSYERKPRHWAVSSDSLYHQPVASTSADKRCSAGSVDGFAENFISFTNASYSSSSEWNVGKNDIFPLRKTVPDRSLSLESHEEESSQSERMTTISKEEIRDEKLEGKTRMRQDADFSQPKEGLCIFVIGGKYCGSHECFAKGIDIWRCDITKRKCKKTFFMSELECSVPLAIQ